MKTSDADAAVRALKPSTSTSVGADTWARLADDIVATSAEGRPAEQAVPVRRFGWRLGRASRSPVRSAC